MNEDASFAFARHLAFGVFFVLGMGTTFSAPSVLFQQAPFFSLVQPEGVCISTYMNAAVCSGLLWALLYLLLLRKYGDLSTSVMIPVVLVMGCSSLFVAANFYQLTHGDISVALLFASFLAGGAGSMAAVIVNPFLTKYRRTLITACRMGGSTLVLFSSLVACIQMPESLHPAFTTKTYLSIFGTVLMLPLVAYGFIFAAQKGHIKSVEEEATRLLDERGAETMLQEMQVMPLGEDTPGRSSPTTMLLLDVADSPSQRASLYLPNAGNSGGDAATTGGMPRSASQDLLNVERALYSPAIPARRYRSMDHLFIDSESPEVDKPKEDYGSMLSSPVAALRGELDLVQQEEDELVPLPALMRAFPFVPSAIPAWIYKTIPNAVIVGWCSFNSWGLLSALIPLALSNSTPPGDPEESKYFAYASQLGAAGIVFGDLSTLLFQIPPYLGAVAFTILAAIIYNAVVTADIYLTISPTFLVGCFLIIRFLGAHLTTSAYRSIAHDIAESHNGMAARLSGAGEQTCVSMGCAAATLYIVMSDACQ